MPTLSRLTRRFRTISIIDPPLGRPRRVVYNDKDNKSGLRGYVQFNTHISTHTKTRMTGPDCAVMCNLINTHTHTHTHTNGDGGGDP